MESRKAKRTGMDSSLKDELLGLIEGLTDEQVGALLQLARVMQPTASPAAYNRDADVLRGLFAGPPDLGERSEDILQELTRQRGAWTQKDG